MRKILLGVLVSGSLHCTLAMSQGLVSSTFDTDADGWLVTDVMGGPSSPAMWQSGVIVTTDLYNWTTFLAPTKFTGDISPYIGGTLRFELQDTLKDVQADNYFSVSIDSAAGNLKWFGGSPSTTEMTAFTAVLSSSAPGWRLNGSVGEPSSGTTPTKAQFSAVLSSVNNLHIDADWRDGPDEVRLDNVFLSPIPEPSSALMLMAGALALIAMLRAQRAA
jgi:hypothetical protein